MARTNKLGQSQIMIGAAESGNNAAQRQHDSRQNRRQNDLDRGEKARQFDESINQREQDRWNQQWQQRRSDRAQRDETRAQNQAGKRRTSNFGNEGQDPGYLAADDPNTPANQENKRRWEAEHAEKQRQFDVKTEATQSRQEQDQSQFETTTNMEAADKGLVDPRMQQMQAEMQRGQEQMGKPVESDQNKGFVKSPERKALEKQKGDTSAANAQTANTNAILRRRELERSYQQQDIKVNSAKTAAERKEATAKREAVDTQLRQPLEAVNVTLNKLRKGDQSNDLWEALKKDAVGVPDEVEIQKNIKAKQFGPALANFMNAKQAKIAVKYTAGTGNMPSGKTVLYSTEGMQRLVKNTPWAAQKLLTGVNAQLYKAMSQEDFISQVNKTAAEATIKGQDLSKLFDKSNVNADDARNRAEGGDSEPKYRYPTGPDGRPVKTITTSEADKRDEEADFSNQPYPTKKPYRAPRKEKKKIHPRLRDRDYKPDTGLSDRYGGAGSR